MFFLFLTMNDKNQIDFGNQTKSGIPAIHIHSHCYSFMSGIISVCNTTSFTKRGTIASGAVKVESHHVFNLILFLK